MLAGLPRRDCGLIESQGIQGPAGIGYRATLDCRVQCRTRRAAPPATPPPARPRLGPVPHRPSSRAPRRSTSSRTTPYSAAGPRAVGGGARCDLAQPRGRGCRWVVRSRPIVVPVRRGTWALLGMQPARRVRHLRPPTRRLRPRHRPPNPIPPYRSKGSLYGAGQGHQGEFVEWADGLTGPSTVEPGEVSTPHLAWCMGIAPVG